jgi:hypothetical protein
MSKVTLNYLFSSLFALSLGIFIGWDQLHRKLAKPEAGISFLYIGISVALVILIYQALIFSSAQKKLSYQLMYMGSCSFTMGWMIFCFFIPLFWVDSIGTSSKIAFFIILIVIFIENFSIGVRILNRKWKNVGATEFEKRFRSADSALDWNKVVKKMKLEIYIYLPGVPESWSPVTIMLSLVFMFVGGMLHTTYPDFSLFSVGIPLAAVGSCCLQAGGYGFAQAWKVRALEKNKSMTLRSVD